MKRRQTLIAGVTVGSGLIGPVAPFLPAATPARDVPPDPDKGRLDPGLFRSITLQTRDAGRLAQFYKNALGLIVREVPGAGVQRLQLAEPVCGRTLVVLDEVPDAEPQRPGSPGLFHVAFLVRERADWESAVGRMFRNGGRYQGASDHAVSLAAYFADPDGNGLELYWDRPEDEWPWNEGRIRMVSRPLAIGEAARSQPKAGENIPLLIGHVHLRVPSLAVAEAYEKGLGLHTTQASYPGARFMAWGGYHHHLAVNVWGARRSVGARGGRTGLTAVSLRRALPGGSQDWTDPLGIVFHGPKNGG